MNFKKKYLWITLLLLSNQLLANFKLPAYQKYQLENGLTVYLMRQNEVPLVEVQFVVKAGSINDRKSYGLANLTGKSLIFGAGKSTKTEIEDQFEFVGANFSVSTDKEFTALSLSMSIKNQDSLMPVFADILQSPNFNKNDFNKFKQRYLSSLEQRRESPKNIIGSIFERQYFKNTAYGNPVAGETLSVSQINIDQVKDFYLSHYSPNNSALIVVGNIEIEPWKQKISQLFSKWKKRSVTNPILKPISPPDSSTILLINKSDAIETTFRIGGKGIPVNQNELVAIQLVNTILGDRFTSWLNEALRIDSGLSYGAGSQFDQFSKDGLFYISSFTKTSSTFEAIDLALKTYKQLWTKGIDTNTLNSAKNYLKGQFPLYFETNSQLAGLLSTLWSYQLTDDYINNFEQKVDELTIIKANKIIHKFFPANNLQFVLIGNADKLREKAKTYGKLTEKNITDF